MDVPLHKYWGGTCPPCPIVIDTPGTMEQCRTVLIIFVLNDSISIIALMQSVDVESWEVGHK